MGCVRPEADAASGKFKMRIALPFRLSGRLYGKHNSNSVLGLVCGR